MQRAEDAVVDDDDRNIFAAVVAGDVDILRKYLDNGGDPNHRAAQTHRGLQARDLLVLVDTGDTLLCVAVYLRLDDVSALLVRAGADWEQPSADGSTSMELAMSLDENMIQRVNAMATADECEPRPVADRSRAAGTGQATQPGQGTESGQTTQASPAAEPSQAAQLRQSGSSTEEIVQSAVQKSSSSDSEAPKDRAVMKRGSSFKQKAVDDPLQESLKLPLSRDFMAMHGYMLKKSTGVVHKWQSRYFVLTTDSQLLYFEDDRGPSRGVVPKGIINLAGVDSFLTSVELLPYRQQVQLSLLELKFSGGKSFALRVHDDEDLARLWLSHLERAVSSGDRCAEAAGAVSEVTGSGAQDNLVSSEAQQGAQANREVGETSDGTGGSEVASPSGDSESGHRRRLGRSFMRRGSFRKAKKGKANFWRTNHKRFSSIS